MNLSMKVAAYIVAAIVVIGYGITGTYILGNYYNGFNVPIHGVIDAVYYTVVTISTVGYGDIVPVTNIAKIFAVTLIISGLSVFLSALTVVGSDFVNSRIEKYSGKISNLDRRGLKDHIVLIGSDTVNTLLAEKLKKEKLNFILITSDREVYERHRKLGYKTYIADATDEEEMKKFELQNARSIIIDMMDKSRMIYVLVVLRNIAEYSKIVTVAHGKEEERNIRSLGIGVGIINPADIVSTILAKKIVEL